MNRAESCRLVALLAAFVVATSGGCRSTTDSLGSRADVGIGSGTGGSTPPPRLRPITGPSSYPNAYHDVLGKTETEIANKIATIFAQLFHGDPNNQAIYVPVGTDQGYIEDVLHNDIRTEGIGYAMLITVELDKREEFDRLWNYAKTKLLYTNGPSRGYYQSSCDSGPNPCSDPFGMQQFVMSLIFAHDRWGSTASGANADAGGVGQNYEADALALLRSLRHTEEDNGSLALGVTNVFDSTTKLVFDMPNVASSGLARPSIEMPGYYDLWAQATGDSFWTSAASSARTYWKTVAHPTTGLFPIRTKLNGSTQPGGDRSAPTPTHLRVLPLPLHLEEALVLFGQRVLWHFPWKE